MKMAWPRQFTFIIAPGFELADVLLDRRAERLRASAWLPRSQERHCRQCRAGDAGHGRRDQQEMTPAAVDLAQLLNSSTISASRPHCARLDPLNLVQLSAHVARANTLSRAD